MRLHDFCTKFQHSIVFLIEVVLYAACLATFFLMFSIDNPEIIVMSRTAAVTLSTFVIMLVLLTFMYGKYDVGRRRWGQVALSVSITVIFTDLITYLELSIMKTNEANNTTFRLENFGILFDGSRRTGKERYLTFTPVTEENAPPYYRPVPLIELDNDNDSNDGMTVKTDMGEKCSGTVTDISDDGSDKNDSSFPLSEKPSLLSQPSQLSQTNQIDVSDPISFLTRVINYNQLAAGLKIVPDEKNCIGQTEITLKKKDELTKCIGIRNGYCF